MRRITNIIAVALTAVVCAAMASAAGWGKRAQLLAGNDGFVAVTLRGRIVIVGGTTWDCDVKRWLELVWSHDPGIG